MIGKCSTTELHTQNPRKLQWKWKLAYSDYLTHLCTGTYVSTVLWGKWQSDIVLIPQSEQVLSSSRSVTLLLWFSQHVHCTHVQYSQWCVLQGGVCFLVSRAGS